MDDAMNTQLSNSFCCVNDRLWEAVSLVVQNTDFTRLLHEGLPEHMLLSHSMQAECLRDASRQNK